MKIKFRDENILSMFTVTDKYRKKDLKKLAQYSWIHQGNKDKRLAELQKFSNIFCLLSTLDPVPRMFRTPRMHLHVLA